MLGDPWRNRCADYFQRLGRDDGVEIAAILEWLLSPSLDGDEEHGVPAITDRLASDLDAIERGCVDRSQESPISEDTFRAMLEQRNRALPDILPDAEPLHHIAALNRSSALRFTHDFGITSPTDGGNIQLGYLTERWNRRFPSNPSEALCNAMPFFWPSVYREAYRQDIAAIQGRLFPTSHHATTPANPSAWADYAETLLGWCRDVLAEAFLHRNDHFINMPNSRDFYIRIQQCYATSTPEAFSIFVFSTTSGLVIKDQFLGSDALQLDPYRPTYFETLRNCTGSIYYQLDPRTTVLGAKGLKQSPLPREQHVYHLASFLCIPNLELSEANFDTPETRWRKHYTLVNSNHDVAYSSRGEQLKHISNGVIATPSHWKAIRKQPHRVIAHVYREQLKPHQVIKHMNEALSPNEAVARAQETFSRWEKDLAGV